MATYTVRPGDSLSLIAKRFGMSSWKDIYHHPQNAAFRKKRPNPDRIFPGDVLFLPLVKKPRLGNWSGCDEPALNCRTDRRFPPGDVPVPGNTNPPEGGVQFAIAKAPEALSRVRTAVHRLLLVRAFFTTGRSPFTNDLERRRAEWHFKVHRAPDPVRHVDRVLALYQRMNESLVMRALRKGSFLPSLFQPGRETEDAVAYTEFGGYEMALNEGPDPEEPGAYIYVPPGRRAGSLVIVHELAHYCGGRKGSGSENQHLAHPLPWPKGSPKEGQRNYADMSADDAFRNTYSYQAYAFPEQPFSRVPAKF